MKPLTIDFMVSNGFAGLRLDQALARRVPGLSRSRASAMVSQGRVRVDGICRRPGFRLQEGHRVAGVVDPCEGPDDPLAEPMDLPVVDEDDHVILINKPAGLVVHPGPGNINGTLVNKLLCHVPKIRNAGEDATRPGIVHRLDKETSGLILVAKTGHALSFLQKEFKQRRVKKEYLALVCGSDLPDTGVIDLPIGRHPVKRKLMAVNHDTGKQALTSWQVQHRFKQGCLARIRLYTGRTHQIRVHFYAIGHPLVGDPVYQTKQFRKKNRQLQRQMLHSVYLSFRHPYSGVRKGYEAPVPEDFLRTMEKFDRI